MTIKTEHFVGINRTPALRIAVEGWHALLGAGLVEDICILHWEQNAIVAFVKGHPVGVIVYAIAAYAKQADIVLGYVRPEHRQRGVYREMFEALTRLAREKDLCQITGATCSSNKAMRATAQNLNRQEAGVLLRYDIPLVLRGTRPPRPRASEPLVKNL